MKNLLSTFLLALLLLVCSCSQKHDPVDDLEALATELAQNGDQYGQSDWEKAAQKYAQIEEDLQKHDYSDEELKHIGQLKAKCFKALVSSSAKMVKSTFHDLQMELEGAAEEMDGSLEELEGVFDEMKSAFLDTDSK